MIAETLKMAGCVVADTEGGLLLLHRLDKDEDEAYAWEFPGGKVDEGEDPAHAAAREGLEETGVEVKVETFLGRASLIFADPKSVRAVDYYYYAAGISHGTPRVTEPEVHDKVEYVGRELLERLRGLGRLSLAVVAYVDGDFSREVA